MEIFRCLPQAEQKLGFGSQFAAKFLGPTQYGLAAIPPKINVRQFLSLEELIAWSRAFSFLKRDNSSSKRAIRRFYSFNLLI